MIMILKKALFGLNISLIIDNGMLNGNENTEIESD